MAKKSKTQRAKASARRAAKNEARGVEEQVVVAEPEEKGVFSSLLEKTPFKSKESAEERMIREQHEKEEAAKEAKLKEQEKKEKKKNRFRFFKDVASELKRVTWPSRIDVGRWSMVVIVALLFFGVYVLVLDNAIVTPLLYLISSIG